jgi:DNA repair proteins
MNIKLTKKERIKILNSTDLYRIMQGILLREEKIDQNREHFWVVGLENNNRILVIELVSMGSVNTTVVVPMEVFSLVLQKRAVKVILVHNHPSGDIVPSVNDKDITDRLYQVGRIVGCPVLDHLIITTTSYMSFGDTGLLETISKSLKYVPQFEIQERLKKEAEELGAKKNKIEIAKEMKRDGLEVETIAQYTGLTLAEIKKLRVRKKPKN